MNYASRTVNAAPAVDLAEEKEFRLGNLLVRPSTREVVADGRSQIIEPRVMQALVVLAQNRSVRTTDLARAVGKPAARALLS